MSWTTTRIDWPRILEDLGFLLGEHDGKEQVACGERQLAEQLQVPRSTLRGWMSGSEPKHTDGERLLDRWCRLTSKPREFAPLERMPQERYRSFT